MAESNSTCMLKSGCRSNHQNNIGIKQHCAYDQNVTHHPFVLKVLI